MRFVIALVAASCAYGQSLDYLRHAELPCMPAGDQRFSSGGNSFFRAPDDSPLHPGGRSLNELNPNVMHVDESNVYVACEHGTIAVLNRETLSYVEAPQKTANHISAIAGSAEPQSQWLYLVTYNWGYLRMVKAMRHGTAIISSLTNAEQGAIFARGMPPDTHLVGIKILGVDMAVLGLLYNRELNRYGFVNADNAFIYASAEDEPLTVIRDRVMFERPKYDSYVPYSTVVYEHVGKVAHMLDNSRIGGAAYSASNGRILARTHPGLLGRGVLINRVDALGGEPAFVRLFSASVSAVMGTQASPVVVAGTRSGFLSVIKVRQEGALEASETQSVDLHALTGSKKEQPFVSFGEVLYATDRQVVAISSLGDFVYVVTKPRFVPESQYGYATAGASAPLVVAFRLR